MNLGPAGIAALSIQGDGMRARIEEVSATHEAHVYEADMADLYAVADHCKALQSAG